MSRGAGAGAAAFGRILGVAQSVDRFKRRVGAYEMTAVIFLRRADPGKFAPIEFDFRAADELFEVGRGIESAHSQAIGLGETVDKIRRDYAAGTRHILHDHRRVAGKMFADVLRHQARPLIVAAAWRRTDNDFNGFTLIEIRLREYPFKVQGGQEFKGQNGEESENLEPLK